MRIAVVVLLALVAGCGGKRVIKTDDIRPVEKPAIVEQSIDIPLAQLDESVAVVDELPPLAFTVYFDFESALLRSDAAALIEDIAQKAAGRSVTVYGACCPLGSDEYNLDLGMRRAVVVRDAIGFGDAQSWGESHLVTEDSDQYHLNRRAEVHVK